MVITVQKVLNRGFFLSQKFLIEVSTNKCYMDVPNPKSTTYLEVPINTCFIENSDKKLEKCIDD